MGTGIDDTQAAIDAATRQMAMIDACGGTWAEADQVRVIRAFLGRGITELAHIEQANFELIAECAMLAGENMQDVRLGMLEEQSDEGPDGFFGFLINLGIMLALELLVVSAASWALPALVFFVASRAQAKSARELVAVFAKRAEAESRHSASLQNLAAAGRKVDQKRAAAEDLYEKQNEHWTRYFEHRRTVRELKTVENEYALGIVALERDADLVKQAYDAAGRAAGNATPVFSSDKLKTFLGGVTAQTTIARVAENTASEGVDKIMAMVSGGIDGALATQFQTSTLLGGFLAEARKEKNRAAEQWAAMRFHIDCLSDEDLLTSEAAQELFFRIHYEQPSAMLQDLSYRNREFMVVGIEGALWFAWLSRAKALGEERFENRQVGPGKRRWDIYNDLYITGFPTDVAGLAHGISYPGLVRISDKHAEYLYARFARSFYIVNPSKAPPFSVPLDAEQNTSTGGIAFDARRYDEVPSMPMNDAFNFQERIRLGRVAEMKLLVILFFRLFAQDPAVIGGTESELGAEVRKILREIIGYTPDDDVIKGYFETLPAVDVPGAPVVSQADQVGLTELAQALMANSDLEQEWRLGDARSQVEIALGRLEMLVNAYPTKTSTGSQTAVTDDAMSEIESAQNEVNIRHAAFLELANDSPDVVADADAQLGERISQLTKWVPGQNEAVAWKWHSPAAETVV